ncbi:hypothetical protein [Priestia megaterium]|uniref:hypothetical protein n=1 Tax=Priestia megaterium TaxID=1404 RepID=UPI002877822C|nr:hypothetical protein [Priestia megaterium]
MINDKNFKEIQEMINECLYTGRMGILAEIARELLNSNKEKDEEIQMLETNLMMSRD